MPEIIRMLYKALARQELDRFTSSLPENLDKYSNKPEKAIANANLVLDILNNCPTLIQFMREEDKAIKFPLAVWPHKIYFFINYDNEANEYSPQIRLQCFDGFRPRGNIERVMYQAWREKRQWYVNALANPTQEEIIAKFQKLLRRP